GRRKPTIDSHQGYTWSQLHCLMAQSTFHFLAQRQGQVDHRSLEPQDTKLHGSRLTERQHEIQWHRDKIQWYSDPCSVDLRLRPFSIMGNIGGIRCVLSCLHCA